jgi:hypothetical protein
MVSGCETADIDRPDAHAELTAQFARYERALQVNDVEVLDELFHADARTIRYGVGENLYGHREIADFRAARPATASQRTIERTIVTTYGRDAGVVSTLFHRRGDTRRVGRQMQTWIRFPDGWKVVAAHVSVIDAPGPTGCHPRTPPRR